MLETIGWHLNVLFAVVVVNFIITGFAHDRTDKKLTEIIRLLKEKHD